MIKVSRLIQSTYSVDNIYDVVLLSYVGKYIKEELNEQPDFSDFKSIDLDFLYTNEKLISFIKEAGEKDWINETFDFYKNLFNQDPDYVANNLSNFKLEPYTKSLSGLGVRTIYNSESFYEIDPMIRNDQFQFIYVSLMAYLIVQRFKTTLVTHNDKHIKFTKSLLELKEEILDAKYSLVFFTHCLRYKEVKDVLYIKNDYYINKYAAYLYDAWGYDKITRGYFRSKGFSVKEKYAYLKEQPQFAEGMPVFMLKKNTMFSSSNIGVLNRVELQIIRDINENSITLENTRINNTREGSTRLIGSSLPMRELYSARENEMEYHPNSNSYSLYSLGINGYMMCTLRKWGKNKKVLKENYLDSRFEEENFITSLDENMSVNLYINRPEFPQVGDKKHMDLEVKMTYVDAVYWLLKDWNVDFNEDLYKEVYKDYFEYSKPLADMTTQELMVALYKSDETVNNSTAELMAQIYQE